MINDNIINSFEKLRQFCEKKDFKGWDPYDGLNSKLFQNLPFFKNLKIVRLFWIQFFKKSPVNFRKILMVPEEYNPKGLGLFLSGYCNLYSSFKKTEYIEKINYIAKLIISLCSNRWSGACWGYNFDWQARAFFQPKNTPTVVASTFIGYSLLDAYDITKNEIYLDVAIKVCDFILKDLNRNYNENGNFAFSYSPLDKSVVFNASLLGSRMLARIYNYTKDEKLINEAKKSVEFCCKYQNKDGSWGYGTLPFHQWIDNFHTGYNLECICEYQKYSNDMSYAENIKKGLDYYLNNFFTEEGKSKYYNNKLYPIDIHAPAQFIVTLYRLNKLVENKKIVDKVILWTINNMQDKDGYFYYQINKFISSKIPYMRWAQAWMFFAMSYYIRKFGVENEN